MRVRKFIIQTNEPREDFDSMITCIEIKKTGTIGWTMMEDAGPLTFGKLMNFRMKKNP